MGVAGSPSAEFQRALQSDLVDIAVLVSRQLPQPLTLEVAALELVALFARTNDPRFDRAAVRWLCRLAAERTVTLAGMGLAADALQALPDDAAYRILRSVGSRGAP
jgi:hypothetical protein